MKRISFEVAEYLKGIGYPQNIKSTVYYSSNGYLCTDGSCNYVCAAPFAMEAWLWLWEKKKIYIQVGINCCTLSFPWGDSCTFRNDSPEEAIIAVIEYLMKTNLIK